VRIKAVIFDLYDTLVHAEGVSWKPYVKTLKKTGLTNQEIKAHLLTEDYSSLEELFGKYSVGRTDQIEKLKREVESVLETAKFFPETEEVLRKLRREGYLIGIISNLSSAYKKPFFDLGLDKMVNRHIFSCEAGIKKPDKQIYDRMTALLGIRNENALMIGDSLISDYQGAKNAGLHAFLLDRTNKSEQEEKIQNLQEIFSFLKAL
jgi:HAD superfamily hydrolase (TIGR01549 family)